MGHALGNLSLLYATVTERSAPAAYYSCNLAALEGPTTLCRTARPKRTIRSKLQARRYRDDHLVRGG